MSLEAALAENTAALLALAEVQKAVNANQERLLAGQQAAIEKIEAPKTPRAAAKKETPATPPAAETPAAPAKEEAPAAPPATETPAAPAVVTDAALTAAATAWMAKVDPAGSADPAKKDIAARQVAVDKLNSMLEWMGRKGEKLIGPAATLTDEERKQAKFFIERWAAGLDVNFDADYDFDGEPTQGAPATDDPLA